MSSSCPTTWETLVRTILKAISSSPIISNLNKTIIRANSESNNHSFIITTGFWVSLVFILVFEGFVYLFGDRLTVENQAFSDGRL